MLFEHANVVRTEHDKSQFAAFQILLIFETLIRRDHDPKPGVFRCAQEITVDQPSSSAVRTSCFPRYRRSGYGTFLSNRMRKSLALGELFYACDQA